MLTSVLRIRRSFSYGVICASLTIGTIGSLATPAAAATLTCTKTSGLAVDADGAPDSYLVDGKGLSDTCDGVFAVVNGVAHTQKNDRHGWFALCRKYWKDAQASGNYSKVKIVGFQKDAHGAPVIQSADDPLPGKAFITTTTLTIPGAKGQRRYVDAREIPYVVLPPAYAKANRLKLGDLVAVYRPKTDHLAFGVYAECCSLGEASVRLHQDLDHDPIATDKNGVQRAESGLEKEQVVFVPLTGTPTTPTVDATVWREEIATKGKEALDKLGGTEAVKVCSARR